MRRKGILSEQINANRSGDFHFSATGVLGPSAANIPERHFRVGPSFAGFGELFRPARTPVTGENLVNGLLRHQLASDHYVFDTRNVADINQWIGVEQN